MSRLPGLTLHSLVSSSVCCRRLLPDRRLTMPKFFCDYCDVYLTHDSISVRKAHNNGRNHLRNVVEYYQQIGHEKAQSVIDSITSSYAAEGQTMPMPGMAAPPLGGHPGFPPLPGAFGFQRPGQPLPPPPFGLPALPGQPGQFPLPPPGRGIPPFPPPPLPGAPGFPPFGAGMPPQMGPADGQPPMMPGQGGFPIPPNGFIPPPFPGQGMGQPGMPMHGPPGAGSPHGFQMPK
ncbi:U1 zinc finger-domain-containing protein [Geopyxis carbonaria]|nr:U1 zinc finger-domain-containing protein [Geopyxis carbonaria]